MCGPMLVAGAALTAASVAAQASAASAQQGARNGVLSSAQATQNQIMQQASDKFNQTLPLAGIDAQNGAATTAAGVRDARDNTLLDTSGGNNLVAPSTVTTGLPSDVKAAMGSAARDSLARGKNAALASSIVGGVADANQGLAINLNKAAQWQQIFGGNAKANAGLVPGALDNANYSGAALRGIGSVLGAAGSAVGSAGLSGAGGAGGGSWSSLFSNGGPVGGDVQGPTQLGVFNKIFQ